MPIIKDPDAIVRVRNNMPGEEAHFFYDSPDGIRKYHIPAGRVGEMRWKDYMELQQYERARKWLSLADDIVIGEDGSIMMGGIDVAELIPLEHIHELLALPRASLEVMVKTIKTPNLVRMKEVADEQDRSELVEFLEGVIDSRQVAPSEKTDQE